MSAIDNSLVGQPTTKRPGGKPEQASDTQPMPQSAQDQPFAPEAGAGDGKHRPKAGKNARNEASPEGDNSLFGNGAGSNAS